MNTPSLIVEALRNQETVAAARERLEAQPHVAQHYRAIRLPALAAAAARVSQRRRGRRPNAMLEPPVSQN
jgi:outer membrane protein TolC